MSIDVLFTNNNRVFNIMISGNNAWIGGKKEGISWKWQKTGQKFIKESPDSDFFPSEPNGDGNCLVMWKLFKYQWGDIYCILHYHYICEIEAMSTTAMTTTQGEVQLWNFTKTNHIHLFITLKLNKMDIKE